jgi:hypothetical protein
MLWKIALGTKAVAENMQLIFSRKVMNKINDNPAVGQNSAQQTGHFHPCLLFVATGLLKHWKELHSCFINGQYKLGKM